MTAPTFNFSAALVAALDRSGWEAEASSSATHTSPGPSSASSVASARRRSVFANPRPETSETAIVLKLSERGAQELLRLIPVVIGDEIHHHVVGRSKT